MIDVKVAVFLMFKRYNTLNNTLGNEYPSSNETSKKNGTVRGDCIACDALFKLTFMKVGLSICCQMYKWAILELLRKYFMKTVL